MKHPVKKSLIVIACYASLPLIKTAWDFVSGNFTTATMQQTGSVQSTAPYAEGTRPNGRLESSAQNFFEQSALLKQALLLRANGGSNNAK